jgi:hypothetical protein
MKKLFIFFIVLLAFVWACEKDIETPALFISPEEYMQLADTGKIINFTINASAYKKRTLKTFRITYSTKTEPVKTLLDSTLNGLSKFNYDFSFRVPIYTDTTQVTLGFYIADDAGNFLKLDRILIVPTYSGNDLPLTEYSGNTIYCDPNYHGNAFNLINCQLLSKGYSDSTNMHLMADFDTAYHGTISKKWHSPAKLKFVQFNGLDYAKATEKSVKAAFDAGAKNDFISGIKESDIYLTRVITNTVPQYIVIRVMNIYDDSGTETDRFIFNVKK